MAFDRSEPSIFTPAHYAFIVTVKSDIVGIMPVVLWAIGCQDLKNIHLTERRTPWSESYNHIQPAFDQLAAFPTLRCADLQHINMTEQTYDIDKGKIPLLQYGVRHHQLTVKCERAWGHGFLKIAIVLNRRTTSAIVPCRNWLQKQLAPSNLSFSRMEHQRNHLLSCSCTRFR